MKMDPDWWLELEASYVDTVRYRLDLWAKNGKTVLDYLPGSELAVKEGMEAALQFYCARYPQYFSLKRERERQWVFHNRLLNTETVVQDHHPLHVLMHNVPEDFAFMLRNPDDGKYYLRAGAICSALGWNLGLKIGMELKEIHTAVPDYPEKMALSMDR